MRSFPRVFFVTCLCQIAYPINGVIDLFLSIRSITVNHNSFFSIAFGKIDKSVLFRVEKTFHMALQRVQEAIAVWKMAI